MAENLGKWPSKRGPISKIRPSDGCGRDAVFLAVEWWYDSSEFGCHPGNVDSSGHPGNLGTDADSEIRPWWPTSTVTPLAPLWHPSGKVVTPWAGTIVPLAESALLKEETP